VVVSKRDSIKASSALLRFWN